MSGPLRPFFHYFGSKGKITRHYPKPTHRVLVEPFAGGAGYALNYPDLQVHLYEKHHGIAGIWDFLIHASEEEVLRLPNLKPGQDVAELNLPQEAEWLVRFWLAHATGQPTRKLSPWALDISKSSQFWSSTARELIASQLHRIRHWKITCCSYAEVPNRPASWFIDPPYIDAGKSYIEHSRRIDFGHLGIWCRGRIGQVMVCEQVGARWLPFVPLVKIPSANRRAGQQKKSGTEALWYRPQNRM